jgi:hypothetical protein
MGVAKIKRLPATPRSLWETVLDLQREFKEFRAQRTLESSSIGAGGVTVQDPASAEKIVITPHGATGFAAEEGGPLYYPPGIDFYTGDAAEVTPGELTAFSVPGEFGRIPVVLATTADLGHGIAYLELQAGNPGGELPGALISVGNGSFFVQPGSSLLDLGFGSQAFAFDNSGIHFNTEAWAALTLANGWTATGGTWQTPIWHYQATGKVDLEGSVTPGTLTAGTVITTIPYPPPADVEWRVGGGSSTASCDLVVHAGTGNVTIQNIAGTITRISLTPISYSL